MQKIQTLNYLIGVSSNPKMENLVTDSRGIQSFQLNPHEKLSRSLSLSSLLCLPNTWGPKILPFQKKLLASLFICAKNNPKNNKMHNRLCSSTSHPIIRTQNLFLFSNVSAQALRFCAQAQKGKLVRSFELSKIHFFGFISASIVCSIKLSKSPN